MKNVKRLISKNKDCRIALVNTDKIIERELYNFPHNEMRTLLEEFITLSIMMSSLTDNDTKKSCVLRLGNKINIFSEVRYGMFSLSFKEELKHLSMDIRELFTEKSGLTISTGDFNTGVYTGSVACVTDCNSLNFAHYAYQSDQTPTELLIPKGVASRGIIVQPMPFADLKDMSVISDNVRYKLELFKNSDWQDIEKHFSDIGNLILEKDIA